MLMLCFGFTTIKANVCISGSIKKGEVLLLSLCLCGARFHIDVSAVTLTFMFTSLVKTRLISHLVRFSLFCSGEYLLSLDNKNLSEKPGGGI